jgi:NhaP-type Na+/H+ or K+/H+ antiporter
MAFGVVGVSLLFQGLSMPLLIRKLGLVKPNAATDELPILRARLHAVGDALLALSHERDQGHIGALPYERLSQSYRREQAQLEQQLNDLETTSVERAEDDSAEKAPTRSQWWYNLCCCCLLSRKDSAASCVIRNAGLMSIV